MSEKTSTEPSDNNLFEILWFRVFPYWLLFALLSILSLILAFFISRREKITYTVAASIAINDEQAAISNNQPIRALNAFSIRQTVDNEALVLHSRSLMEKVVKNLHLYAPIGTQGRFSESTVYSSAPIIVEALNPDSSQQVEKVYFSIDNKSNTVEIQGKRYGINQWITFPYGTLRFIRKPGNESAGGNNYYFSLLNPTTVANGLLQNLTVTTVSKLSTVINLTYQSENPEKAADILNELLQVYISSTVDNENQLAANTLQFVEQRLREVETELDSIERKIQQYKTAKGIIDLSQQGRIYLEGIASNDQRITDLNTQLAVLNQVDLYLDAQGRDTGIVPTSLGISDPVLAELLQRLNGLELQLANLKTTTGMNNPLVVSLENEIQKIRPNIRNIVASQRARLVASRANLNSTSSRFNRNVQNIPAQERQLLEISRQQAVKRDLYSFLLQRREEAALSNSSNTPEIQIIDIADADIASANSKKLFFFLGSLIVAFALAIAYILIKEVFNSKIMFRSSIENLTAIPIIAEINKLKNPTPQILQELHYKPVLEQFRKLPVALGLYSEGIHLQNIMVTSSISNEGKTLISSHLATALALTGRKVVLLDFNFYNPESTSVFLNNQSSGIKDFLVGNTDISDIIKKTEIENLHMIPAGSVIDNSVALLTKIKLKEIISFLGMRYDHIIFDTPPVELVSDAYMLARFCDLSLFIVRYNVTPQTLIKKIDENPRINKIENLKIVFNGIKGRGFLVKYFGYGFGYGKERKFKKTNYYHPG